MSEDRARQRALELLPANLTSARDTLAALIPLAESLGQAAEKIAAALLAERRLLVCGNGGSAADAAHLAAEFAGRYVIDRRGYDAIDLSSNHSLVTALINDYPAEDVFARQVQALGHAGDVLIVLTTSGNSPNIKKALESARKHGLISIAFLGKGGGACKGLADIELIVPSNVTARIQEAHEVMYHTLCEALDPILAGK